MNDRGRVGVEQAGEVGRRVNLVAHLLQAQKPAVAFRCSLLQPLDLMGLGGNRQHARTLPFGVQAQSLDVGLHAVEVLSAHRSERVDLVGPARFSVLLAVCQAGVDEPSVAAGGGPSDPVGLDQDDSPIRITLRGMQCGPQTGVAAADHQ